MSGPLPLLPSPEERRRLRDMMGVTIHEAASEIGVSWRTYLRWEWGDSEPLPGNRRKYHEQLTRWREAVKASS